MKKFVFLFPALFLIHASYAQQVDYNFDAWFLFNIKHNFNDTWSFSNELHLRRSHGINDKKQFLWRPAVHYKFNDEVMASAGVTYIQNYPYGSFASPTRIPERNIWEQIAFSANVGKLNLNYHLRFEHRFIGKPVMSNGEYDIDGFRSTQRLRNRFTLTYPIISLTESSALSLVIFEEVLVNAPDFKITGLNQNWFYAGLSYPFSKTTLQLGYMNQWVKVNTDTFESNRVIWLNVSYNL